MNVKANTFIIGYAEIRRPTDRQLEVLRLAALGLWQYEIAETLGISQSTVRNHIQRAKYKLLARTLPQAIVICIIKNYLIFKT